VAVAYVHRAKGVRGEVKAEPLTHDLGRFDRLTEVVVQKSGRPERAFRLASWRVEQPGVLLKFDGVDTPEEARELLVGGYVTVAPEEVPPLPPGSYYEFDLIGCQVEDEYGSILGRVAEVHHLPTTDAYLVVGERGEFLVPAIGDFVVMVDVARKKLLVRGVGELLDVASEK
jgi:16S rRNA processing protein RimM